MQKWLQKILPPSTASSGRNLPAAVRSGQLPAQNAKNTPPETLPSASVIYGVAASLLGVVALYLLFSGRWVTALLVFLLAACFLGYALHFLKYRR
ncbi:MAG: hypothetical protein SFW62_03180 [Alphaproteobacteria bacterium]|nr:hypothetical protein [Alphaproteobacteria bacterium]